MTVIFYCAPERYGITIYVRYLYYYINIIYRYILLFHAVRALYMYKVNKVQVCFEW